MSYDCTLPSDQVKIAKAHRIHQDAFFTMISNYDPGQTGTLLNDLENFKAVIEADCSKFILEIFIGQDGLHYKPIIGSLAGGAIAPANYFSFALFKGLFLQFGDASDLTFYEGKKTPANGAAIIKIFSLKYNNKSETAYYNFSDQE